MLNAKVLVARLISNGIAHPSEIRGCSEADLLALEQESGVTLPMAYREFMMTVGRGAGKFLQDVTVFYPDIKKLTQEVVNELPNIKLPSGAFVFLQRLGEVFLYFVADGSSADPPIYRWSERRGVAEACESIWVFIGQELDQHEQGARGAQGTGMNEE
jgi:hypothetical protein